MASSSPTHCPSTPSALRNPLQFKPLNSSPLVESPGKSSPVAAAQARRRFQYKAHAPTTPLQSRSVSAARNPSARLFSGASNTVKHSAGSMEDDPQKVFLRDRFRARCLERAVKAREKAIRGKRYAGFREPSSDDYPMDDDDEEDDEDIMQDELFRRIMANTSRKERHSYRISYAQEVGSSFDPDLEDISSWEQELRASNFTDPHAASSSASASATTTATSSGSWPELELELEEELTPVDLDDEELEAYAEECARRAALADFEDIPEEELFSWSDVEDFGSSTPTSAFHASQDDDVDMS